MKTYSNARDFLADDQPPEQARTPAEERIGVALPGDPVETVGEANPYVGKNPQALLRLLRSGSLDSGQEALVRRAIALFEDFSSENLTGGVERAVPVPGKRRDAPGRDVDPDVLANPDYDPALADLFR